MNGASDFANGIVLLGVPAVVLVPLVVEGLKRLGLPVRWATLAAMIAGALVAALAEVVEVWPAITPAVRVLLAAILLGFGASGVYSQARAQRRRGAQPVTGHEGDGGDERDYNRASARAARGWGVTRRAPAAGASDGSGGEQPPEDG
ncbi:MAG: hypothetical protein QJR03_10035 [Sphaerobacter sp.]|nr:hypothetical protein [Sphaerobacter sp.]